MTAPRSTSAKTLIMGPLVRMRPAQNASGNWGKVVQRVPLRLKLLIPNVAPPLWVGMTAHVSIDTQPEKPSGALATVTVLSIAAQAGDTVR